MARGDDQQAPPKRLLLVSKGMTRVLPRLYVGSRRDAHDHPSPNGGWCEAAWAGALGVQLGGRNVYFNRVEERGLLGDGPRPTATELRKAARLVGASIRMS